MQNLKDLQYPEARKEDESSFQEIIKKMIKKNTNLTVQGVLVEGFLRTDIVSAPRPSPNDTAGRRFRDRSAVGGGSRRPARCGAAVALLLQNRLVECGGAVKVDGSRRTAVLGGQNRRQEPEGVGR